MAGRCYRGVRDVFGSVFEWFGIRLGSFFGGLSPFFGLPGGPLGMAWGLGSNIHRDKKGRTDDPERANLEKSRLDQVLCNCLNMGSKAWLSGDVGIDGCTVDKQN